MKLPSVQKREPVPAGEAGVGVATEPRSTVAGQTADLALKGMLAVIKLGPLLVLIAVLVLFSALSSLFFTGSNLQAIGVQTAPIAVLALGQLLVILTRGIDLSVGSVIALSMIVGWVVWGAAGSSGALGILAVLGTGALVGLVNGLVFVKFRIPHPFIVTLGTLNAASGLALVLSNGEPKVGVPDAVLTLGSGHVQLPLLGSTPVPLVVAGGLAVIVAIFAQKVQWGRWIYVIGGNPEGAVRAGIPVSRVLISVYVLSGLSAGIAALLIAGRTDSAYPTAGYGAELEAIAAVIIGGASFFGGRGSVLSAVVGALIIGSIRNGLNIAQISPNWQLVAVGVVVVGAVALDVGRAALEQKARTRQAQRAEAAQ